MEDRKRVRQEAIGIGREYWREKERDKKRNGGREREREIMNLSNTYTKIHMSTHTCIIYAYLCICA